MGPRPQPKKGKERKDHHRGHREHREEERAAVATAEDALLQIDRSNLEADPFQLVLLDAKLEEDDGFELAEQIELRAGQADTRILMLTSPGLRGDRDRCRQAGVSGYLLKPVNPDDLLNAIHKVLSEKPRTQMLLA